MKRAKPQPRGGVRVAIGQSYQSLAPGSPGGRGTATVCYPQAGVCSPGGENPRRLRSKRQLDWKFCWTFDNHSFQFAIMVVASWRRGWPAVVSGAGGARGTTHGQALAPTVAGLSAGWMVYAAFYTYSTLHRACAIPSGWWCSALWFMNTHTYLLRHGIPFITSRNTRFLYVVTTRV